MLFIYNYGEEVFIVDEIKKTTGNRSAKEIFAKNLRHFMDVKGIERQELADALGTPS